MPMVMPQPGPTAMAKTKKKSLPRPHHPVRQGSQVPVAKAVRLRLPGNSPTHTPYTIYSDPVCPGQTGLVYYRHCIAVAVEAIIANDGLPIAVQQRLPAAQRGNQKEQRRFR